MMSDRDIKKAMTRKELVIDPYHEEQLQPCSYDLTLGPGFKFLDGGIWSIYPKADNSALYRGVVAPEIRLKPGVMLLVSTHERVELGPTVAARVEGKSSLARLGLMVHATAGFIDAGFRGQITLELTSLVRPIMLSVGMPIAQMSVFELYSSVEKPYAGKYQDQTGATGSRYHENWTAP